MNKNIQINTGVIAGPDADPVILFHMMNYYKSHMEAAQKEAERAQNELHLMGQHAQEWKQLQAETYEDLLHTRMIRDQERAMRTRAERQLQITQNTVRFLDSLLDERMDMEDIAVDAMMELSETTETIDLTTDEDMEVEQTPVVVIDLTEIDDEDIYFDPVQGVYTE